MAKVVAREVSCGRGRVLPACAAEARGWIGPGPPLHTCSGPLIVDGPKMEDTCSCPLQTLMVWVVAVDVLIAVCYGWKDALNK